MEHKPDKLEKGIRFGCGGLLGILLGLLLILWEFPPGLSYAMILAVCLAGAVICGTLAAHYGDRFWYALKNWIRWL